MTLETWKRFSGKMCFVVGSVKDENDPAKWEIIGVFMDEENARKACSNYDNRFIGPLELDKELPDELSEWPGAYKPGFEGDPQIKS